MMLDAIKFDAYGLVPAIIQDEASGAVLMLAYMNKEALQKSLDTAVTWFYSRSKQRLWQKGETTGHTQSIKSMYYDCDADAILIKVAQAGAACHEGSFSCFTRELNTGKSLAEAEIKTASVAAEPAMSVLYDLYNVIHDRKHSPKEGSYTTYLFEKGQDKILKKVGEESAETIIASKNESKEELLYEMADLWYHCLVLLAYHNVTPTELLNELRSRRK